MTDQLEYIPLPTLKKFHASTARIRCVVGPVGSSKSTAAVWEVCYYLPKYLKDEFGITSSRWVIVRNTLDELRDTTQRTMFEWFPFGDYKVQKREYNLNYDGMNIEILFRACDRPDDVKKFKSLEITGYLIDESIEVKEDIKKMLKNRIGRFPRKSPLAIGVEVTNPPDVEHQTYSDFKWVTSVPGPISEKPPLDGHIGFWQPPRENEANLRDGYYDDLIKDYANYPDWVERYVDGKPGITVQGKLVYNNFSRGFHVSPKPLKWKGDHLFVGWDNTGNCPAAVIVQMPVPNQVQVLREYHTEKMNIVDFTSYVVACRNRDFPKATFSDFGDPAGSTEYPKKEGGFTSNATLMHEECGIEVEPSEQNLGARTGVVDGQLGKIIGGKPGLLIDPSCVRLINGFMGGYCYKEIGTTGIYSKDPVKNRFSHVQDSLQYVLIKLLKDTIPTRIMKAYKKRQTSFMAA